jgi:hypothetical protein
MKTDTPRRSRQRKEEMKMKKVSQRLNDVSGYRRPVLAKSKASPASTKCEGLLSEAELDDVCAAGGSTGGGFGGSGGGSGGSGGSGGN